MSAWRAVSAWWRRIDLDGLDRRVQIVDDELDRTFRLICDDGSRRAVSNLLNCVLLQALVDRAIAVQFFGDTDDECLRMLYCLALPPDYSSQDFPSWVRGREDQSARAVALRPIDPSWARIWFEMVPPPPEATKRLFRVLRRRAGIRRVPGTGVLQIRYQGRNLTAAVEMPVADEARIYFADEHPPIRPKLARHYAELGLPAER